jgi:hypothetical protein
MDFSMMYWPIHCESCFYIWVVGHVDFDEPSRYLSTVLVYDKEGDVTCPSVMFIPPSVFLLPGLLQSYNPKNPKKPKKPMILGDWVTQVDFYGNPL